MSQLHCYLIPRYQECTPATVGQLPDQNALSGFAKGLAETHEAFCSLHGFVSSDAVVVMVVQPGERNAFDQRWLQLKVCLLLCLSMCALLCLLFYAYCDATFA